MTIQLCKRLKCKIYEFINRFDSGYPDDMAQYLIFFRNTGLFYDHSWFFDDLIADIRDYFKGVNFIDHTKS